MMVKEIICIKSLKMTKVTWIPPKLNTLEMETHVSIVFPKETFEPIFFFIQLHKILFT